MALPRIRRLASSLFEKEHKQDKEKKFKNDLLNTKKDDFYQSKMAYDIIRKNGFSHKTLKLTKNFNKEMKEKFLLLDTEYLIVVMAMNSPSYCTSIVNIMAQINVTSMDIATTLLSSLFKFYFKGIVSVVSFEDRTPNFQLTPEFLSWVHSKKEFTNRYEKKTRRQLIMDIDYIANMYNTLPIFADLGESIILKILTEYKDKDEYAYILYRCSTDLIAVGDASYKFLLYIVGHLVLHSIEYSSINLHDELIAVFTAQSLLLEDAVSSAFNEKHYLMQNKIFDRSIDDSGKADKLAIELHADFKRKYVKDIIHERSHNDLIRSKDISKKELFFNKENQQKLDELKQMLSPKSFASLKRRLKKEGMRTGFACIFSGPPGTGKTEAVAQFARETGRDILKVDMSQVRSKWWGEDEKNVKNIFTNYKSIVQDSKIEPILLLNEADAIIGKRLSVDGNNGAIVSSINATQNIILDALEDFEGILIATTNLTSNMDDAFTRRFIYKIEFETPSLETREKILINTLKIPEKDAHIISKEFTLSGGNIENIHRKLITRKILYNEEYSLEKLKEYCKDEKLVASEDTVILGFSKG